MLPAPVFLLLVALLVPTTGFTETHTLQAIEDFPILDAAETPFYKDTVGQRNVLAINAAVEAYRDKFARAEATFTGTEGSYDLTLTTLGEIDGECVYRILINGEVKATFTNAPTEEDYAEQTFLLEDAFIPAGAVIGVEAKAVSNGLIPEHGAFAFARGRWRSLELVSEPKAEEANLALTGELNDTATLSSGEDVTVTLRAENLSTLTTATSVAISMPLPETLAFISAASCAKNGELIECVLPELMPQETSITSINLKAAAAGTANLEATLTADQTDPYLQNNLWNKQLLIAEPEAEAETETEDGGDSTEEADNSGETDTETDTDTDTGSDSSPTQTGEATGNNADASAANPFASGGGASFMIVLVGFLLHLTRRNRQQRTS